MTTVKFWHEMLIDFKSELWQILDLFHTTWHEEFNSISTYYSSTHQKSLAS